MISDWPICCNSSIMPPMQNIQSKTFFSFLGLPTIWRYFFTEYVKVFGLTLFGFIVVTLSSRLQDFARFVSLGADFSLAVLYIAYQIPYVLQVALPIASLVSAYFLFNKLSQNNSLSALRASGMSLMELVMPILLLCSLLGLANFRLLLDVSAHSHLAAKRLEFQLRSINPLSLLQNPKMLQESGISVEMKGALQHEGKTQELIMAARNKDNGRSAIFIAKELYVDKDALKGRLISLISNIPTGTETSFDHLLIENSKSNEMRLEDLSQAVNTKHLKVANDELSLHFLFAKLDDLRTQIKERKITGRSVEKPKKMIACTISEIARRSCLSLAIITSAILGLAFGFSSRGKSTKLTPIKLAIYMCLFLFCYLGAKAVDEYIWAAIALYTIPNIFFLVAATSRLLRLEKGYPV